MSAFSKVQIYQMVADQLDEETITSTDDDNKLVDWLNRNYDLAKETLLSTGRWNFAKKRLAVAERTDTPDFEWLHWYDLPSDCLFMYPLTVDGRENGSRIPYVIEGDKVLTNQAGPLYFRWIANVDEDVFHPLFTKYMVCYLSHEIAHWMTGKVSYVDITEKKMKKARREALVFNALNNDAADAVPADSITSRY